jgi:hypothetical protein
MWERCPLGFKTLMQRSKLSEQRPRVKERVVRYGMGLDKQRGREKEVGEMREFRALLYTRNRLLHKLVHVIWLANAWLVQQRCKRSSAGLDYTGMQLKV